MAESQNISELLNRVGRIVHGLQFANGLNPAQWEALRFLSRANCYSRTPGALAEYLGSTKGTISQTLIALEAKGYVNRTRSKHDRRSVNIELTDDGLELVEQDPLAMIGSAVDGLTDVDREGFARSMGALIKSLKRDLGQVEFGDCGGCVHNRIDGEFGESCHCLFKDEPLSIDDTARICLNFRSNRPDS